MTFWQIVLAIIVGLFLARVLPYPILVIVILGCLASAAIGALVGALKIKPKK